MKKPIVSFMTALLVILPSLAVFSVPMTAQAATPLNALVKGSEPAIYWVAMNGKRYVFPNIKTFWTWFSSDKFNDVITLSDAELASIPLGGNVTYRPGAKLVKITTDPKVYAVSRYGVLHWLNTETLAKYHYGNNWNTQIEDVADSFFINYKIGSPIINTWDYNGGNEYNGVSTPSDSLMDTLPSDALTISLSKYAVAKNESSTLTASLTKLVAESVTIDVLDEAGNVVKSCGNATSCSAVVSLTGNQIDKTYHAQASYLLPTGKQTLNSNLTTLRFEGPNGYINGSVMLVAEAIRGLDGEPYTHVVATAMNPSVTDANITIRLYSLKDKHLLATCVGSTNCGVRESFAGINEPRDVSYLAVIMDDKGQTLPSAETSVNVQPKSWLSLWNSWVFTADQDGVKIGSTQDIENENRGLRLAWTKITANGKELMATDENVAVAPKSVVHIEATVVPIAVSDTLNVELRDQDGTIYKTCQGVGNLTCAIDITLSDTYKNHFFVVRAKDQLGRHRDFRLANHVYVVGNEGFSGNVRVIADKASVTRGETLQLATKMVNQNYPIAKLTTQIYNLETGTLIATCKWTTECKTKTVIDNNFKELSFYAVVVDDSKREMAAGIMTEKITVTANGNITVTTTPGTGNVGQTLKVNALVENSSIPTNNLHIELEQIETGSQTPFYTLLASCDGKNVCSANAVLQPGTTGNNQFRATIWDKNLGKLDSASTQGSVTVKAQ